MIPLYMIWTESLTWGIKVKIEEHGDDCLVSRCRGALAWGIVALWLLGVLVIDGWVPKFSNLPHMNKVFWVQPWEKPNFRGCGGLR